MFIIHRFQVISLAPALQCLLQKMYWSQPPEASKADLENHRTPMEPLIQGIWRDIALTHFNQWSEGHIPVAEEPWPKDNVKVMARARALKPGHQLAPRWTLSATKEIQTRVSKGKCPPKFYLGLVFFFVLFCFFVFLPFSRATPASYGGSQARGQIGALAAGLRQSHSNSGS